MKTHECKCGNKIHLSFGDSTTVTRTEIPDDPKAKSITYTCWRWICPSCGQGFLKTKPEDLIIE